RGAPTPIARWLPAWIVASVEELPIGPIHDGLVSAADDVALHGESPQHLIGEPQRKDSPPRRKDGEDIRSIGFWHALDQLQGCGQTMDACAREWQPVVSTEPDDVETGALGLVHDGSGISHDDAFRFELRKVLPQRQMLVTDVAGSTTEEPFLITYL